MTCEQCYVCEQTVLRCSRTMLLAMTYDLCHGGHMVAEYPLLHTLGDLKIALRGGGGGGGDMDARRRSGGGLGEMGFRVGPFVLCKNGCWRWRRRNTNFGPKKFFPPIISPHLSSQNDQRDVGNILSHRCWVDPPPPPRHGRSGTPALNPPPPVTAAKEGGGWENGLPCHPPPPAEQFSSHPAPISTPGPACTHPLCRSVTAVAGLLGPCVRLRAFAIEGGVRFCIGNVFFV